MKPQTNIMKKDTNKLFKSAFNSSLQILDRISNLFTLAYAQNIQQQYYQLDDTINNIFTDLAPFLTVEEHSKALENLGNVKKEKEKLNGMYAYMRLNKFIGNQQKKYYLNSIYVQTEKYHDTLILCMRLLRAYQELHELGISKRNEVSDLILRGRY